jgi:hypothetical protein
MFQNAFDGILQMRFTRQHKVATASDVQSVIRNGKELIMNLLNLAPRWFALGAIGVLIMMSAPSMLGAQDTTTTNVQPGSPVVKTSVRNAEVVYVEGNDLVLKLESGKVEHLVVPDSDVFTIDGTNVGVGDLKPGTKLTQTISTTTTPHYVNSVRTIKGKVWHVSSPNQVIISLPDGTNQIFRIPSDAKFSVGGHERHLHELRKGMTIEATIVTDDTHHVVSQNKTVIGEAPAPQLPRVVGVLMFPVQREVAASTELASSVTTEHVWSQVTLPQTGSPLPLIGLTGLVTLAFGFALRLVRERSEG